MHLTDHTIQKGFITFAMTAKKSHLAGVQNAGNIVALLKQPTTSSVDE
jgi:hypothetical protein